MTIYTVHTLLYIYIIDTHFISLPPSPSVSPWNLLLRFKWIRDHFFSLRHPLLFGPLIFLPSLFPLFISPPVCWENLWYCGQNKFHSVIATPHSFVIHKREFCSSCRSFFITPPPPPTHTHTVRYLKVASFHNQQSAIGLNFTNLFVLVF